MRILDLDLDFFVSPIANDKDGKERLDPAEYQVESLGSIERFLVEKCKLVRHGATPGCLFEEHVEVFDAVRALDRDGRLADSIEIDHIDAHSDTGMGLTTCWVYVCTELLHKPKQFRTMPKRGHRGLNSGNFLIFLAACGWLKQVRYVHPPKWRNDVNGIHMKDFSPYSEAMQLKRFEKRDLDRCLGANLDAIPHELEPPIAFSLLHRAGYQATKPYDFVFLTRSPAFTPQRADEAFDFIAQFFQPTKL